MAFVNIAHLQFSTLDEMAKWSVLCCEGTTLGRSIFQFYLNVVTDDKSTSDHTLAWSF